MLGFPKCWALFPMTPWQGLSPPEASPLSQPLVGTCCPQLTGVYQQMSAWSQTRPINNPRTNVLICLCPGSTSGPGSSRSWGGDGGDGREAQALCPEAEWRLTGQVARA